MSDILVFNPSDKVTATLDWTNELNSGALTVSGAVHTVPSPLTLFSQTYSSPLSQVTWTGGAHGVTYMITGQATLSNGEVINKTFAAHCLNA